MGFHSALGPWARALVPGLLVAGLVVCAGCRPDLTGKACATDEDCGPGYDCYRDSCHRVCAKADDCPDAHTCVRYHCIAPQLEPASGAGRPGVGNRQIPPPPDPTLAELRAIRRELELLRRDVARIAGPEPTRGEAARPKDDGSARGTPRIVLPPSSSTPTGK